MNAEERFPELANFELEMKLRGRWGTFRANEHEVAAHVLADGDAISRMLTGAEVHAQDQGERYRCRLTPKAWLTTQGKESAP